MNRSWRLGPETVLPAVAYALALVGCGGAQPCPEVDEEAIAKRTAEIVLERLADEAGRGAAPQIAGEPDDEPDEPIAVDEDDDEAEDDVAEEVYYVPTGGSPSVGPKDALVTVVMFTDVQCPFCDRAYRTIRAVSDRFDGHVRIVIKNHPLPMHEDAMLAHHALMEAKAQKGDEAAFAMLEAMFEDMAHLEHRDLEQLARKLELSLPRFRKALKREKHAQAIADDLALGNRVGVRGTPTFFVNGVKLVGAVSYYAFFDSVRGALEQAEKLVRAGVPKSRVYHDIIKRGIGAPDER